jgi:hypothetical protein
VDVANEQHLARILAEFSLDLDAKYRAGQEEHGGNMWEKKGMLTHAIQEAIDQVVYLYTLREQMRARGIDI